MHDVEIAEDSNKSNTVKTILFEQVSDKFLTALKQSKGIIYVACNNVGINRTTYYRWLEDYPDFKAKVEEINEAAIDFVESKLLEKVNGVQVYKGVDEETGEEIIYNLPPSDTAIIFFLKTRAKKRGYVESLQVGNIPGESFNVTLDLK